MFPLPGRVDTGAASPDHAAITPRPEAGIVLRRFIGNARRSGLFPSPGGCALVACSGGPDSMALLDLACRAGAAGGFAVAAAHLNHRLRGVASDADEALVVAEGARRGIAVRVERLPDGWRDALRGESWEMAARRLRRGFLGRAAGEAGAGRVLLGHTADDLAETVLLRILRGTGPDGLAGIPALSEGIFAHPLLPFTRREVMAHLAWSGTPWREDATNGETTTGRGRVRGELLPLLRRANPSVDDALVRLAAQAAEDRAFFEAEVDRAWPGVVSGDPPSLSLAAIGLLPPPVGRRLLQRYLALVAGRAVPSTVVTEALAALAVRGDAPRVRLPGGAVVAKEGGSLRPLAERGISGPGEG